MRWFTDEALTNDDLDWDGIVSAYSAHLAELAPRMSSELRALAMDPHFDLKDGRFREVRIDQQAHEVMLAIHCGNLEVGYRALTLRFNDAAIEPENLQFLAMAVGATFRADHWSSGRTVTEIHHTEFDVMSDGRFIVRLRLWPFHEFGVAFGGLSIAEEATDDRGPQGPGKVVSR